MTLGSSGDTIAVMANGVDRPSPMGNRELLGRVAGLGLMISEAPPGAVPTRHRFLARAHLMAVLSATTVVVEAGARSGSMTVARHGHELGRTVGAVPGPVAGATRAGPQQLLRDCASLVADAADLLSPRGRDSVSAIRASAASRDSGRPSTAKEPMSARAL